jgi:hypothetical protein
LATPIAGEVDDISTTNAIEGMSAAIRITDTRAAHTSIRDAAGNDRGLNIGSNGEAAVAGVGTAGLPDGGVMTVQGVPGGTDLPVSLSTLPALTASTAAIGKLAANDGVDIGNVDVASLPALATGSNTIGKLAANSGVDIGNVGVTSLPALPVGSNKIGEVDVASLPPLAAGSNAIGKLAANSGVIIGDVNVTALPALAAGTNAIGKLAANSGVDIGNVGVTSLPGLATSTNNVGHVHPAAVGSTSYWSSQSSGATQQGSAVDTTYYRTFCWSISLASTSSPVGTFEIDGSIDGTDWYPIYIDANKATHYINGVLQTFSGGSTLAVSSPAGTVKFGGCIESTMPSTRIVYTRASGGTTSTLNASYSLRAF